MLDLGSQARVLSSCSSHLLHHHPAPHRYNRIETMSTLDRGSQTPAFQRSQKQRPARQICRRHAILSACKRLPVALSATWAP